MYALAMRSLRLRKGRFLAGFISIFLGATFLMAFASMLDTAGGKNVDSTSEETLTIMAMVVGGWGLLLVLFAVASTLTLQVRQRGEEIALLKSVGATPRQVRRMIVGEAAAVSLTAAVAAIPLAMLGGWALLAMLDGTGQVADDVAYSFGPIALVMGLGITFASATFAALITARRASRMRVIESLVDTSVGSRKLGWKRIVAAIVFLAAATDAAVIALAAVRAKGVDGTDAMAATGQASIFASIGFAFLAPWLIRKVIAVIGKPIELLGGVAGHLTVQNMRQRSHQMASAMMPIILFTGIGVGTLYMEHINNARIEALNGTKTAEMKNVETLDFVVIGMIVLFAAVLLINTLIAATTSRRREFGQQRLSGATPGQVLAMVTIESVVLTIAGVVFGTIASLFTIIPFSVARTGELRIDGGPGTYVAVVAIAAALTLAASLGTARRTLRRPAVEVVGAD